MAKRKYLLSLTLVVILVSLFLLWLAVNRVSFVFSLAALGYPQNLSVVALNLILLSLFVLFIRYRGKLTRLPASIYLAFVVALFVEMYGFPLTVYIITWSIGYLTPGNLWYLSTLAIGQNLFVSILFGMMLPLSNAFIIAGALLVIFGWKKIFSAKDQLVTTGIYGRVRHPQYLGILLITVGINVLWITISTLLLWPILVVLYYRLAKKEEKSMEETFGEKYLRYKQTVPMFIPRLSIMHAG
jgi:protein-S-isoprenylcysteine O-methyltransferase Ste14